MRHTRGEDRGQEFHAVVEEIYRIRSQQPCPVASPLSCHCFAATEGAGCKPEISDLHSPTYSSEGIEENPTSFPDPQVIAWSPCGTINVDKILTSKLHQVPRNREPLPRFAHWNGNSCSPELRGWPMFSNQMSLVMPISKVLCVSPV